MEENFRDSATEGAASFEANAPVAEEMAALPQGSGKSNKKRKVNIKEQLVLHSMLIPGVVIAAIFMIAPMVGVVMAFQDYSLSKGFFGSPWVGLHNFQLLFMRDDFFEALWNTVLIAFCKIACLTVLSIVFALLLNEIQIHRVKKTVQTIMFLPYFLSWALLGNIFVNMLPTSIMENGHWFRFIVIVTDVWKQLGYQAVIFLAAITNIDPTLYEAAKIDGANHTQCCRYITLPGLSSMIVLNAILNIGNIMNAGFEQILVMYNSSVYEQGDILDTMAFRYGWGDKINYPMSTAVSLFKSLIGCAVFSLSYFLARKFKGYKIF